MNQGNLFPYTEFDLLGIILFCNCQRLEKTRQGRRFNTNPVYKKFYIKKIKTTHNRTI